MGGEFGTAPAAARAAASLAGLLVRLFGTFRRKRSSTAAMDEAKGKLSKDFRRGSDRIGRLFNDVSRPALIKILFTISGSPKEICSQ